jgi:hypothetical protein
MMTTTTTRILDIVPPLAKYCWRHSIRYYVLVKGLLKQKCDVSIYTLPPVPSRDFRPSQACGCQLPERRIGLKIPCVNGTTVLVPLRSVYPMPSWKRFARPWATGPLHIVPRA